MRGIGFERGVPARQSSTLTTRPPRNRYQHLAQFKYQIGNPNAIKKLTIIEGTGYEARQTSKEQTKMPNLCWKIHDPAQSFVLRSYTIHELRNQHVSIG